MQCTLPRVDLSSRLSYAAAHWGLLTAILRLRKRDSSLGLKREMRAAPRYAVPCSAYYDTSWSQRRYASSGLFLLTAHPQRAP